MKLGILDKLELVVLTVGTLAALVGFVWALFAGTPEVRK